MLSPTFAVVIPTYNRAQCLTRALDSVLIQTYKPAEVIVVDDGSTDNTPEVIARYVQQHNVKFVRQHNQGGTAARNRGAAECTSDYITFVDSDDAVAPNWLEMLAVSARESGAEVIFCGYRTCGEDEQATLRVADQVTLPASLWYAPDGMIGCFDHAGTFACRRQVFMDIGGFRPGLASNQLNEFGIRLTRHLATRGCRASHIDRPLVVYYANRPDNIRGNIEAVVTGTKQVMEVHRELFLSNPHIWADYCTVVGVRLMALRRVSEGRRYLFKAARLKPTSIRAWLRLVAASIPMARRTIWQHMGR